jgi:hypothetical protein
MSRTPSLWVCDGTLLVSFRRPRHVPAPVQARLILAAPFRVLSIFVVTSDTVAVLRETTPVSGKTVGAGHDEDDAPKGSTATATELSCVLVIVPVTASDSQPPGLS